MYIKYCKYNIIRRETYVENITFILGWIWIRQGSVDFFEIGEKVVGVEIDEKILKFVKNVKRLLEFIKRY